MRKLLMASAVCVLLTVAPTRAQIAVTDGAVLIQSVKSAFQDLKAYATQLQQLQQQIQSVMWAANTFEAFVQNPNIGAAMSLMQMAGIENPLPVNPYAVLALSSGYGAGGLGSITSRLGSLNGLFTGAYERDRIYNCTDDSFACRSQTQRALSNSGIKGMTSEIYSQLSRGIEDPFGNRDHTERSAGRAGPTCRRAGVGDKRRQSTDGSVGAG